jgi:transcriptional regulator with XRE-family HTH domain
MRNEVRDSEERRRELSAFLRTRRARINPSDVGLLAGARRRTPGLRREEVALLANIGVTWYTRLEQGLPINVSADVLNSIATALQLTTREREHLFLLAGQYVAETSVADTEQVSELLQRVLDSLEPSPAVIRGRRFDVLAWNRAATALFGDYGKMEPRDRNSLWRFFMNPAARACFPRWEEAAPKFTAQFRAVAAKYLDDPCFTKLINDLLEASPEFRHYWSKHDVASPADGFKHIYHPVAGELTLEYTSLSVPDYPDMRLIVYTTVKGSVEEQKLLRLIDESSSERRELVEAH